MSIYIAPAAMGLGDLVVTLPVVQSLINRQEDVYLVLRLKEHLPLSRRISGLSGAILEWQFEPSTLREPDRYYDLRDHDLQRECWWGSRPFELAHPGFKINDLLGIICRDFGLAVEFDHLKQLTYVQRSEVRRQVVFVPGSAVAAKCWPPSAWLTLLAELTARGLDTCVIGQPESSAVVAELIDRGLTWCRTPTIADALDVVSSCAAVVSVDTGIMHLSIHQGTPTIGIFRQAPVYVRNFTHFRPIVAAQPCLDSCYELEVSCSHHLQSTAGPDFQPRDWHCQSELPAVSCMETILPITVTSALLSMLQLPLARQARLTPS